MLSEYVFYYFVKICRRVCILSWFHLFPTLQYKEKKVDIYILSKSAILQLTEDFKYFSCLYLYFIYLFSSFPGLFSTVMVFLFPSGYWWWVERERERERAIGIWLVWYNLYSITLKRIYICVCVWQKECVLYGEREKFRNNVRMLLYL